MSDFQTLRTTMVDTQVRPSDVTKFPIIDAMLSVPREAFVPDARVAAAYADTVIDLGAGREMFDARTLAKMLDEVAIEPTDLVLDLGAGLGYGAAVLARMADFVVAVEEDESMARDAEAKLAAAGADNVAVITGALNEGAAKHGPYDVIIVEGAVQDVPAAIKDQLQDGGRIIALFNEGNLGRVKLGLKRDGNLSWRFAFNASGTILPGFETKKTFAL
ncbi:MAG: protein-L-isoaspartate O-methyltransferase family protein [Maritimibacter sp.]